MKIYKLLAVFLVLSSCATTIFSNYQFKHITYKSKDNHQITSDLYLPRVLKENNPVVIVIHGGGWRSRSGDMSSICKRLVNEGYIAINITYRLAPEFVYPTQENDVAAVLNWIKENKKIYNIDTEKIYAWGYSAGAHLAFNLANEAGSNIKAVVAGGTPTHFPTYPASPIIINYMGSSYKSKPELWYEASPISRVSAKSPPTFLYHGENDFVVHIEQSEMLANKLKENKIEHEFYRISLLEHVSVYYFSAEAIQRGLAFIKRY